MRPCLAENLLRGLGHVVGFADIERNRLGLAASLSDFRHHCVQRILPAPGNHYRPAVRGQGFRTGLADAAAAARHPGHAFPVI